MSKWKEKFRIKQKWKKIKFFFRVLLWIELRRLPWLDIVILILSVGIGLLVYHKVQVKYIKAFDPNSVLSNLLVINGVFSAVLMTFLFSRIGWTKERKYELYKEALVLSQKITDYRRILHILIQYYNVWIDDRKTKSLFDHGRYKSVEYWEWETFYYGGKKTKKRELIQTMVDDPEFDEGLSVLYLAMTSLVHLRGRERFNYESELYHDFDVNGLYTLEAVNLWMEYSYFEKIWYWINRDVPWIQYHHLSAKSKAKIKEAATRINPKFATYEVNNDLLEELTEGFTIHYLNELKGLLLTLKKGNHSLNLLMTILICCSIFFGVLLPLVLLLAFSQNDLLFRECVAAVASMNAVVICYFLCKFPFLINKELRFI